MQGIFSTSDGRTKNPTGDNEAIQKLTIVESHHHPWKEGWGERCVTDGRCLPGEIATVLDTGREGEKHLFPPFLHPQSSTLLWMKPADRGLGTSLAGTSPLPPCNLVILSRKRARKI